MVKAKWRIHNWDNKKNDKKCSDRALRVSLKGGFELKIFNDSKIVKSCAFESYAKTSKMLTSIKELDWIKLFIIEDRRGATSNVFVRQRRSNAL